MPRKHVNLHDYSGDRYRALGGFSPGLHLLMRVAQMQQPHYVEVRDRRIGHRQLVKAFCGRVSVRGHLRRLQNKSIFDCNSKGTQGRLALLS